MPTSTASLVPDRPATVYLHTGIGGAGNYHKFHRTHDSELTASSSRSRHHHRTLFPRAWQSIFGSGKGGASNGHAITATPSPGIEEELTRVRSREQNFPSTWFVGIGGIGNLIRPRQVSRKEAFDEDEEESASEYSEKASPLGAAETLKRKMRGKLMGMARKES
ncbi:MAG: hypothetical protein Q9187_005707 [Circinaria calcarea]